MTTAPPAPEALATADKTRRPGWTAGRITLIVLGSLATLISLAAFAGGGTALIFDQTQRDSSGYLMTDSRAYSTGTYALVSDSYRAGTSGDLFAARDILGTVRIRAQSTRPVFVGIAPARAVDSYLGAVRHEVATALDAGQSDFRLVEGGAPVTRPAAQHFWAASAVGTGIQTLSWSPRSGSWRIAVMNANGAAGVSADLSIGARFPDLLWIGIGVLGGGLLFLLAGGGLIFAGIRRGS